MKPFILSCIVALAATGWPSIDTRASAQEPQNEPAPRSIRDTLDAFRNQVTGTEEPANPDWEPGNLSEVGAKEIGSDRDFEKAVKASEDQPVVLFKHSTQCEISGAAYRRMAAYLNEQGDAAPPVYLVKVIERRPVSQKIAEKTKVKHESPQVIVLSEGDPVWNTSHEKVTAPAIDKALRQSQDES